MKYYGRREWLKDIRESKKLTQFEAALAIDVTPEYYQKLEYGTKNPSIEVAVKLSQLFGFPVERLVQSH
ncbi:MAG: helix-turn-helix transcriptional regulator [Alphaproteobacteria bacterium]|nr:helix-turn-helix transcriptional regulator [Alphaproteobacteria bacterium]